MGGGKALTDGRMRRARTGMGDGDQPVPPQPLKQEHKHNISDLELIVKVVVLTRLMRMRWIQLFPQISLDDHQTNKRMIV
ncbi:hypothetical protein ACFX13_033506 [Malus domestica]